MMTLRLIPLMLLLVFQAAVVVVFVSGSDNHQWYYTFVSSSYNSTNEKLCCFDLHPEFIERGKYAFSGYIFTGEDLTDDTSVEMKFYRSANRNKNFKLMPYSVPKGSFSSFMNTFYKSNLMPYIAECAPSAPQFVDTWDAPLKAFRYEVKQCVIPTENLPTYLPEGLYRALFIMTGPCELYLDLYLLIEVKEKFL